MPDYEYKARDKQGQLVSGVLGARNRTDLRQVLAKKDLIVVDIKEEHETGGIAGLLSVNFGISPDSLIVFCHQLSAMVNANIPIIACLDILWKQTDDRRLQLVISKMKTDLLKGSSFSDTIAKFPNDFPPIFHSLIKVGETGAGIGRVLQHLTTYLNKQRELVQKVRSATWYPMIIIFVSVFVVIGLIIFVVPVFKAIFRQMSANLPLPTQILIFASEFLKKFWWVTIIFIAAAIVFLKKLSSTLKGKEALDRIKFKLPLIGKFYYKVSVARFVQAFNVLILSGVPITVALEYSSQVSGNTVIIKALTEARERIAEGSSIAAALEEKEVFPPMLTRMVAVGEEGGTLAEMLTTVSSHMDEEIDYGLKKLTTALEPILILSVAAIVGFILLAIYMPIFSIWKQMR